jgi:site-specific recombinase XerC
MRATAATNALAHNADIAKVQEWLGHADISTFPRISWWRVFPRIESRLR